MAKIAVYGAGGWGTALAVMLARAGHAVTLWSPHEAALETLRRDGENRRLLPGVRLPDSLAYSSSDRAAAGADFTILAVPSFAVRETARRLSGVLGRDAVVVNAAKGFEEGTLLRPSQVIGAELPQARAVALSGPSHAEEVSRGVPSAVVAASPEREAAWAGQAAF